MTTAEYVQFTQCPVCGNQDIRKLPEGWEGNGTIAIVGCGNPFHYTEVSMSDGNAAPLLEGVPA